MARSAWSTSNFFRYSGAVVSAVPLSIAAWFQTSITGQTQLIAGIFNSAQASDSRDSWQIRVGPTDVLQASSSSNSGASNAASSATVTLNAWQHALGVFTSDTSRTIYLNGGNSGSETVTSRIPAAVDRTSIGIDDHATAGRPLAPSGTGYIGEVAFWNVALTAAEAALLAKGFSPLMVRPAALVSYWPLWGNSSPEINYLDRTAVQSMQGTVTKVAHPRVIMPRRNKSIFVVPAAPPAGNTHQFFAMF